MKRFLTIIALCSVTLASCNKEIEDNVAKAVLGDVSILNFAASNPSPQTVEVVSDGEWHTNAPDWITVDPTTGSGVTTVTVTASSNTDANGMLEPRKDTLFISGNTLASRLIILVNQEGDSYRNAERLTLDKVAALADGKAFILNEATVAAVTSAGFIANGNGANVYFKSSVAVKVGDKISAKGIKGSSNGVPVVSQTDECTVTASGSYTYPEAIALNEVIAGYKAEVIDYATASGIVSGGNLSVTVNEVEYSLKPVDTPAELSLSSLNGNKVDLTGYTLGLIGVNQFGFVITEIRDNGPSVVPRPDKLLHAKWRFTTSKLVEYADLFGGTAGVVDLAEGFGGMYVPSNAEGNGKIEYYQVDKSGTTPTSGNPKRIIGGTGHPYVTGAWPGDYWLFSATDNYEYPAGTTLHIKFLTRNSATGQKYWMLEYFDGNEWKPAEDYPVEVESETGNNVQYNFIEPTANVAVECYWKLAAPCREPMFRMRCVANWQCNGNGALANPNGGTTRIADNDDDGDDEGPVFEVTDAPAGGGGGGSSSGVTVFEDDFEWVAPWASAANAGDAVATNNPSTTAPNVFTAAACAGFLEEAAARGYTYFWGPTTDGGWSESLGDDNPKVLYLQSNYLKFGKSDVSAGIKLPALSRISGTSDIELSFDWCWQVTGAFKPDLMTLAIVVEGSGSYNGGEIESGQSKVDGESKIEWQHATVTISGASSNTRISISPANADPKISNPERGQNRWYLDNIKIVTK
ncbi:MAG: hypothetical protein J1D85_03625 [Bacteroidales bacterium]|nr:hypothetical protein [Bacteroidales bacterium]